MVNAITNVDQDDGNNNDLPYHINNPNNLRQAFSIRYCRLCT